MARALLKGSELLQLEVMLDATSVAAVLIGLEEICGAKADHIQQTWQDDKLARLWGRASLAVGKFVGNRAVQDVSL